MIPDDAPDYVKRADEIRMRLRNAETIEEIERIADEERRYVKHLHDEGCQTQKSLALGIINLKMLRLNDLNREGG